MLLYLSNKCDELYLKVKPSTAYHPKTLETFWVDESCDGRYKRTLILDHAWYNNNNNNNNIISLSTEVENIQVMTSSSAQKRTSEVNFDYMSEKITAVK